MTRKTLIALTLLACAGLAACGGVSAYDQYTRAYDLLSQESSFAAASSETSSVTMTTLGKEIFSQVDIEYQVAQVDGEYQFAARQTWESMENGVQPQLLSTETYIRDGRVYSLSNVGEAEETRSSSACEPDYAFRLVLSTGIIWFPEEVIASQSTEDTDAGRLLSFSLDPEKYFEWR